MILTFIEIRDGKIKKSSLEALGEALSDGDGTEVADDRAGGQ